MSDSDPVTLTHKDFETLNSIYYIATISVSLLIYDYLLTFSMEVERFWTVKKFSWAVFFFYINRYVTILGHMPVMLEYFWQSTSPRKYDPIQSRICSPPSFFAIDRCHDLHSYHQYFVVCVQIYIAVLIIMRVYALYDRSKRVLALYICVAIAGLAVGCWSVWSGRKDTEKVAYELPIGCPVTIYKRQAMRLASAWCTMLVFDTLVFSMTVYKSIVMYRALSLRNSDGPSILATMLRDGSLYFGAMIACNVANVLTFAYGTAFTKGVTATLTNSVSSVLISRLMFNLRDPHLSSTITNAEKMTTMAFHDRSAFGSSGGGERTSITDDSNFKEEYALEEAPPNHSTSHV